MSNLKQLDEYRFLIEKSFQPGMRIDGMIYATEKMMNGIRADQTLQQVANVATLPGLVGRSMAMPDAHQGYGFPIGGVAASDFEDGIVSAGGVGFDINCGVRLLSSGWTTNEIRPHIEALVNGLFKAIPCGAGKTGRLDLSKNELDAVMVEGASWVVDRGYGEKSDLLYIEEQGKMLDADPSRIGSRAYDRGDSQLGTLGSGNHFVEIQSVTEIFDEVAAKAFGLFKDQVTVLIHTGSRGFGHQICTDYLETMQDAAKKYKISLIDRQLACAPIQSREGKDYLAAMAAAANFAFANRQSITHWIREVFFEILGSGSLPVVYDVAHNIAKLETHLVGGRQRQLLIHRKGATRSFPKHRPELPEKYYEVGQPVLIPGSMGTASYVLVGTEQSMQETFGSTCHGAGRTKSRHAAMKEISASQLVHQLNERGIVVRGASKSGLSEEHPGAYKDVDLVVDVVEKAGLARKVAKMVPMGVIKG
jgi:tRNA-splicing ligase RtcB